MVPGAIGSLHTILPNFPAPGSFPSSSNTRISKPGTGFPAEVFGGSRELPKPTQVAVIAWAVSVCHQLLRTGALKWVSAQTLVFRSHGSPAMNMHLNDDISYFLPSDALLSAALIALTAVGVKKHPATLWSDITRKNCSESGVPTGFPSYITVVFPCNNGE